VELQQFLVGVEQHEEELAAGADERLAGRPRGDKAAEGYAPANGVVAQYDIEEGAEQELRDDGVSHVRGLKGVCGSFMHLRHDGVSGHDVGHEAVALGRHLRRGDEEG
jgi:hypothetical protein